MGACACSGPTGALFLGWCFSLGRFLLGIIGNTNQSSVWQRVLQDLSLGWEWVSQHGVLQCHQIPAGEAAGSVLLTADSSLSAQAGSPCTKLTKWWCNQSLHHSLIHIVVPSTGTRDTT